jgi:hypothetical protein
VVDHISLFPDDAVAQPAVPAPSLLNGDLMMSRLEVR